MKKLLLPILLISLMGLFFVISCEKDKDKDEEKVKYSVVQEPAGSNTVILINETEGASCLWEWFKDTSTVAMGSSNSDVDTISFAFAGEYTIKITVSLAEGSESKETTITVNADDATLFTDPIWEMLTGGVGEEKAWVLDVKGKAHEGPLSFMGTDWDFAAAAWDGTGDDEWLWDAPPSFTFELTTEEGWKEYKNLRMELPGETGYGTMYFDLKGGYNYFADKKLEDPENGTYVLNIDEMMITLTGATILSYSYKPYAEVKVDPNCETDCENKPDPVDGRAGISNWSDYMIYDITDTVLRLAVSRDQDVQGEGTCWLIYNFISEDFDESYVAPTETFTYEESVKTSFTQADLVGTWKYGDIPQGWVAFTKVGDQGTTVPAHLFETWQTRADVVASLESWGATDVAATFTAGDANTYVFNADGSCDLNGTANTYTVSEGVITFGTALAGTEFNNLIWIELTGTELKVIDFTKQGPEDALTDHSFPGVWIGNKNGSKDEYQCIQLVKQ